MLAILLCTAFFSTIALVILFTPGRTQAGRGPLLPQHGQERTAVPMRLPQAAHGLYRGDTSRTWAMRYRARTSQYQQLRHVLFHRPSVTEAIALAAATYGHSSELWRKARCETGGTYSPRALNAYSGAAGLFQFLRSTWTSTPYGRFSIWSPYANALAAGWMHAAGRGGEWVCR